MLHESSVYGILRTVRLNVHSLSELEKFKRDQTMFRLHDYVKTIAHKT